jgi:hypothetical protein
MRASSQNKRRSLLGATALTLLGGPYAAARAAIAAEPRTIVMLDFELISGSGEKATDQELARLNMITGQLREAFAEEALYSVLDPAPASELIDELKNRFELHQCNGCDTDIGQALGADRVLTAWVQKTSNLILNINIRIRDVKTGDVVLQKSVDIRGNNDKSWHRGIRYMVRSMVEKGQFNR